MSHEVKSSAPMSISRTYEFQRDVFFYIMDIQMYEKIFQEDMAYLWKDAMAYGNMRDLMCEIVARGDIIVEDKLIVFFIIVDL